MQNMYYIGLDVHKRTISYCVKDGSGAIHAEGTIPATRFDLDRWMRALPQPWTAAMEATVFTGWIYDHLQPHAAALKVAHPLMLRAIAAAKKKNDRIDASKICDCLQCDFLPECYMASTAIRERRRTLRYRNLLVRQMVQMKNKIGVLLMEAGVSYNKQKLDKASYFRELLATNPDIDEGLCSLLRLCRETVARPSKTASALVRSLERDSGNTVQRTPLSKQGNKHLQTTLIESAKMSPRNSSELAMLYDREKQKGNANRATLAVARKLVAYLMAVDRGQRDFQVIEANGSLVLYEIGTPAERPTHAAKNQKGFVPALLRSAPGELLPSRQRPIMEVA